MSIHSFRPSRPQGERQPSPVEAAAVRLLGPIQLIVGDDCLRYAHLSAWPALLTKQQLETYLGASWATLAKVCPVAPIDIGANLLRFSRAQIDAWVASLPAKARKGRLAAISTANLQPEADPDHRAAALAAVRERASRSKRR